MKQIGKTIIEEGLHQLTVDKKRVTVRAVMIKDQKILLLYSKLFNDYTFPGGGVKDEDLEAALKRELKEEIGALDLKVIKPLGFTKELRYGIKGRDTVYEQTSYYFLSEINTLGETNHVEREKEQGLQAKWIGIKEAINHNISVSKDALHQKKGLKTVMPREHEVLLFLLKNMRKFEVVSEYKNLNIEIPKRATKGSAGYDLSSIEDVTIKPGEIKLVKTGLKVQMPENEVLLIYPRSSLGIKKGLMMSNGVGVVDSDYYNNPNNEGHLMVPLYNFSEKEVAIAKGERIAQGLFQRYETTIDDQADNTRVGGFGSSDKKER